MEFNFIQFLLYLKLLISFLSLLFGIIVMATTIVSILYSDEKFTFKKHIRDIVTTIVLFMLSAFTFSIKIIE